MTAAIDDASREDDGNRRWSVQRVAIDLTNKCPASCGEACIREAVRFCRAETVLAKTERPTFSSTETQEPFPSSTPWSRYRMSTVQILVAPDGLEGHRLGPARVALWLG
jgi:hypothetical protein